MGKWVKMGRPGATTGVRRRVGVALVPLVLLSSGGCTSDWFKRDDDRRRDDPLLGAYSRPPGQPVAVATANQPTPTYSQNSALPPLVPATPTSNAALASGQYQPLTGGNELRIGNTTPTSSPAPASTWQPAGPQNDPMLGGGSGGSPLRPVGSDSNSAGAAGSPVRPVTGATTGTNPPLVPTSSSTSSLDRAMDAVLAERPLWHRLTYNGETREYRFQAKVPVRGNASQVQTIEGEAPTPEAAIRSALEKIGVR